MHSEKFILFKILTHHLSYLAVDGRILLKWILMSGGITPPILNSHCRKSSYFSRTSLKNNNMDKTAEDLLQT